AHGRQRSKERGASVFRRTPRARNGQARRRIEGHARNRCRSCPLPERTLMPYVSNRAAVEAELEQLVRKNAEQFADRAVRLVQESYREPKSGRLYRIGKTPTKADRRAK